VVVGTDSCRELETLSTRPSGQRRPDEIRPMDAFRRGDDVRVRIDLPGVTVDDLEANLHDRGLSMRIQVAKHADQRRVETCHARTWADPIGAASTVAS